jgi:glycine cleavage system aminomethyltransferase T
MIFPASTDDVKEPRGTPLFSAVASMSAANSWTSVNGWAVPRVFSNIEEEYARASEDAVLVDLGPLCRYTIRGAASGMLLSRLSTAPASELGFGESARGLVLSADGRVVDYAETTRLAGDLFLLTTTSPLDRRLQLAARGFDAEIQNIGAQIAALGLVGPRAREIAGAAGFAIESERVATQGRVRGVEIAVRPISIGSAAGLEIIYPAEEALTLWERLRRSGKLIAAGLEALEVLRIEGGTPRLGVDFQGADGAAANLARTPEEIGLPHLAPPNRGWFSGRRGMIAASGDRRLVVLAIDEDEAPVGAPVMSKGDRVGQITSSAYCPTLRRALAFADVAAKTAGESVETVTALDGSRTGAAPYETAEARLAAAFRTALRSATE